MAAGSRRSNRIDRRSCHQWNRHESARDHHRSGRCAGESPHRRAQWLQLPDEIPLNSATASPRRSSLVIDTFCCCIPSLSGLNSLVCSGGAARSNPLNWVSMTWPAHRDCFDKTAPINATRSAVIYHRAHRCFSQFTCLSYPAEIRGGASLGMPSDVFGNRQDASHNAAMTHGRGSKENSLHRG
jgi:hypothetical protein